MRLHTLRFDPSFGWSSDLPDVGPHALVLAFAAAGLEHSGALAELHDRYPDAVVTGCSTAGEVFTDHVDDGTIAVAVADFEATTLTTAVACVSSPEESGAAGRLIADTLYDPDLRSVLVLSDGTNVSGSALLEGLASGLPESVVLTGGLAGDADRFERTWVLHEGAPVSGLVSAVGFLGEGLRVGHGSDSVFMPPGDGDHDGDCLAIAISCIGRKPVLGQRIEHEIDAVRDRLPRDAKLVGFYSYGAISPDASGPCELHDRRMTLTTIAERRP